MLVLLIFPHVHQVDYEPNQFLHVQKKKVQIVFFFFKANISFLSNNLDSIE